MFVALIVIVISIVSFAILAAISLKSKEDQKEALKVNLEICFSLGIYITFFMSWLSFTTDNLGLGRLGIDTQNLLDVSWFFLIDKLWDICHFGIEKGDFLTSMSTIEKMIFFCGLLLIFLPLLMAVVNVFLLIAGRVRYWSFLTGIATFIWIILCTIGYYVIHGSASLGIGFIISFCCAIAIMISSLLALRSNSRQYYKPVSSQPTTDNK